MKSTVLFGGLIAACCIGCVIGPASARSGGGGGAAAAAGAHGGLRAGSFAFRHGARPIFGRGFAARHAFRFAARRQQLPLQPYWPAYGDFDPFYSQLPADPGIVSADATAVPAAPSQVPPNRVLVVTPGCRTQDQQVRSEAGGVQVIHITRCY